MDVRKKTAEGLTICPQCGKTYTPDLPERTEEQQDMNIQDIYPDATPGQREQLVTGLCCDRCWDQHLGAEEGTYNDKGERINNDYDR